MAHPLEGSYSKIRRARQHLRLLKTEIERLTNPSPYSFFTQSDPQAGKHYIRVRVERSIDPSANAALMAGDTIHNLRAALDHLVYQLAEELGTGAGRNTAFPIQNDPKQYWGQEPSLLRGVAYDSHRTRIEALQPYHAVYDPFERLINGPPETMHLAGTIQIVQRLDNWDKHRLLLPTVGVGPTFIPVIEGLTGHEIEPASGWIRMEQDAILATIVGGVRIPGADVKMKRNPAYTVVFGNPDADPLRLWGDRWTGAMSYLDLRNCVDYFYEFIKSFRDDF